MNDTLLIKLDQIIARYEEMEALLASGDLSGDDISKVSQEYASMNEPVKAIKNWKKAVLRKEEASELLNDSELGELAALEIEEINHAMPMLERNMHLALLPRDEADERSAILEIRPAAGGDEATIFAGELFDSYRRYSEKKGWKFEIISFVPSDFAGMREGVATITGKGVFSALKYESGVHRVQRVPATESQGRIHTSTVTVAVLPEAEEVDIDINPEDLRIDVYRASGAGGQHVNKTESAVRITHLPTGLVVAIQEEKSQHRNRQRAMQILRARLYDQERQRAHNERAADRKSQVGTGDRSERIRTYNFPQGRVTDHRINLTLYQIDAIMNGEFDEIIESLLNHEQMTLLAEQGLT